MTRTLNVELGTGEDLDIIPTVYTTATGSTAKDITGATCTYSVRDKPHGALLFASKTVGSGIVLTTPATGILTISIASTDTSSVTGDRDYYHELEIVIGGVKKKGFRGRFHLHQSVAGTGA